MTLRKLEVYFEKQRVGRLELDNERKLQFSYDAEWLKTTGAQPISCALPLHAKPFEDAKTRPFFANLLPENAIRRAIALDRGISEGNDFGLLEAIGGECAGAISLWPSEKSPPRSGSYEEVTLKQLDDMILDIPDRPLIAGPKDKKGYRLSLAGAQPKIPVFLEKDKIYLPQGSYSSSHIIKPPITKLKHSVYNEAYCMHLADALGLGVPKFSILGTVSPSFCIERYDRIEIDGTIQRLHQEDFCQVLSVLPDGKYEAEGGPSLRDCFRAVAEWSTEPATDRLRLLRWAVFNQIIGNADAHAKNISFLFRESTIRLAPFYDLLSTRYYPRLTDQAAMRIGNQAAIDSVSRRDWEQLAEEIEIKASLILSTASSFAEQIGTILPTITRELSGLFSKKFSAVELESFLKKRCLKTQRAIKK